MKTHSSCKFGKRDKKREKDPQKKERKREEKREKEEYENPFLMKEMIQNARKMSCSIPSSLSLSSFSFPPDLPSSPLSPSSSLPPLPSFSPSSLSPSSLSPSSLSPSSLSPSSLPPSLKKERRERSSCSWIC